MVHHQRRPTPNPRPQRRQTRSTITKAKMLMHLAKCKKKLYEISDDPRRKEFLDDLFAFMQRRGSPINRLPIMAKSVLDLYELYNLVIARGGLVEVINKKLWQEIIKGLRLPSSITSAAFTLRTQYMKYLYDYECEKKNISTREQLDAAIESNKREGRRSSGPFDPSGAAMVMTQMSRQQPGTVDPMSIQFPRYSLALPGIPGQHIPQPNQVPPVPEFIRQYHLEVLARMLETQRQQQGGAESPQSTAMVPSSQYAAAAALSALEVAPFITFNSQPNRSSLDLEPQREALNLSPQSPASNGSGARRRSRSPCTSPPGKRFARGEATDDAVAGPSSAPHSAVINSSENLNNTEESDDVSPPRNLVPNRNGARDFSIRVDDTRSEVTVSLKIDGVTYNGTLSRSLMGSNGIRQQRP